MTATNREAHRDSLRRERDFFASCLKWAAICSEDATIALRRNFAAMLTRTFGIIPTLWKSCSFLVLVFEHDSRTRTTKPRARIRGLAIPFGFSAVQYRAVLR
jgi:hypothetical protein